METGHIEFSIHTADDAVQAIRLLAYIGVATASDTGETFPGSAILAMLPTAPADTAD